MALAPICVPNHVGSRTLSDPAAHLIDRAFERIEALMLRNASVTEQFVTCDFELLDKTLGWLQEENLLAGNRFCEWGSGIGAGTMLAALRGLEAVGIEIDSALVQESDELAAELTIPARFVAGSFLPSELDDMVHWESELENVVTQTGNAYDELDLEVTDFDLFFAFPWPGEQPFFEAVLEAVAANGSLLLTFHGREGMTLVRKTP
ncbi:class I SAM-dependent methyltransferase [Roseimaritima sediminicola]|uniref:hypothetical protein n=1 Tax=Roseimaritima sediminicola TaxID=2662066 RepID=UPI00129856EC|nr:hypothetical protein [Roseimaritima sediminicola]